MKNNTHAIDQKLEKSLGYYIPNRFTLHVDGDLTKVTNRNFTVFIHEYGHLLQNLFTIFGWYSFAIDTVKLDIVHKIAAEKNEYRLPMDFSTISPELQKRLNRPYAFRYYAMNFQNLSGKERISNCETGFTLRERTGDFYGFTAEDTRRIIYSNFSVDGKIHEIEINYIVLIESMSYIIEKHYNLASIPSPDFPYNICTLLFQDTSLEGKFDKQLVILYLSLLTLAPEVAFHELFSIAMSADVSEIVSIIEFTNVVISRWSTDFRARLNGYFDTIDRYLRQYFEILKRYELSSGYITWLTDSFNAIKRHVLADVIFFLKPILYRNKSNMIINQLDFDYFLMVDKRGKYSTIQNKSEEHVHGMMFHTTLFHAVEYILNYKRTSHRCPVIKNCREAEKNCKCLCRPYTHSMKQVGDELCEYGIGAHTLFFHEIPVRFG